MLSKERVLRLYVAEYRMNNTKGLRDEAKWTTLGGCCTRNTVRYHSSDLVWVVSGSKTVL